jgi:hypothetical protein
MNAIANNFDRRLEEIEQVLEEHAAARAKTAELEERMKRAFAAVCVNQMDNGKSAAAAEKYARASKPYSDLSDEWIAANYESERLYARVKANDLKIDVWRSLNATERAKMSLR